MKNCKYFQQLLVDEFYSEINSQEKSELDAHLQSCENCKTQQSEILSTLNGMKQYERKEPKEEFWNNYWLNLEGKLDQNPGSWTLSLLKRLSGKTFPTFKLKPNLIYGFATAAAFLIIGIFIGKLVYTPEQAQQKYSSQLSQKDIHTIASAERFLERSKVLFLGIVNMDTYHDSEFKPSISKQQEISRELIQQTAVLKDDLQNANQKILLELINELETILLQIANLEKDYDLDAVQLIQNSLDRKGILIKINLGEILSNSKNTGQKDNKKNKRQS